MHFNLVLKIAYSRS